jgi:hypothetical protein
MRSIKWQRLALWTAIGFGLLIMLGCERKTINELKADPGRYANQEVAIVGTVTRSASVLGKGVYEIEDGTGKLWVICRAGTPRQGAKIIVRGTIRDAYNLNLFKIPDVIGTGMAMMENSHQAR